MANIPKLRLMLAQMEKTASARWRTLQGLTALLGKDTVAASPRIGALQLAAQKQGITLPGEGFAKAMSSLPERPLGLKFDNLSMREPSQIFRGGNQPADLIRGGYSTEYLHATPFKNVAEAFGGIKSKINLLGPPNAASNTEGGFVYRPRTLVGVYDTAKNQRYTHDYGLERNATNLTGADRVDPTAGLSYAYRALQDKSKLKKLNERGWPVGWTGAISPTPSSKQLAAQAHFSNRYETAVKPSQLHSILLDNRVLPATAKGRELLQTGTMPAGAQLPPEILKGRELLQTSAMPASAQLPATSGQGVRTFPEIQQFLRKRYAAPAAPVAPATSPSLWSKMLNYFQNFSMPAGAKLPPEILKSASWMDMVQRAIAKLPGRAVPTTPIGKVVYRGFQPAVADARFPIVHASAHPQVASRYTMPLQDWSENSFGAPSANFANWAKNNGQEHRILRTFGVDPQVQKHFPQLGFLSMDDRSKHSFRNAAQIAFNLGGRTMPEIQQFLKKTPWYQKKLPERLMLEQMSYETGVPSNSFTGLSSYNPLTRTVADIPHNIAKDLIKGAGIADIANRVLSTLIKSPITPSFVKNTFYPGFPAVREALRATGRVKTVVPSTGVGDIPTFAVRGENSPAFKALKSRFKTMVPENQTPEGVFDKITTEMSGTPLQRTYSGFAARNQAKADFKHEPWGEIYTAPRGHYMPETNVAVNFRENNETMRHELAHALQYQLPNSFNSLHTLSTGTKLPVVPRSGWTTVRGTMAPSGSSFLREINANAASSKTPLGQIGRAIGFATAPSRARYYAPKYTPTEKWVHDTLSFPRDIPRRVMGWINKDLVKGAGVFTASGNKVQGVGLRKLYHSLLDERGLTGLGVNNEDTGDVELSFDGDEARRKEVFKELAARIKAKTNHPVTFAPTTVPQTSTPVKLSNKDSERLNAIHHLAYRMSNMYDPTHPLMDPNDTFKQKLADRFRLQVNKRGLTGTVPSRAAEQLLGTRPMYAGMMPARRTRSEAEALSDMPMTQQQRLLKALKSGRGFLAPAGG